MTDLTKHQSETEAESCPHCGGNEVRPHVRKDGFDILKCGSCGMVYLDHRPTEDWSSGFYTDDYFEASDDARGYENYLECEPFLSLNFTRKLRHMKKYVPGGNVLDLGCGYGYFLKTLGDEYNGYGVDVSEHAARVAREKYGVDVRTGPITRDMFPPDFFSMVTMWDAVEHLIDPRETLGILHGNMKAGAYLALATGDVDSVLARVSGRRWHLYTLPEHLWFFSRKTMTRLLQDSGFQVVEMRHDWGYYSVDYLIERVLKGILNARSALNLVPGRKVLKRLVVPISLFDIMFVVCRKV